MSLSAAPRRGPMAIKVRTIGQYNDRPVLEATLESSTGVKLAVISYGAIVRNWQVPVAGRLRSVVLGFDSFPAYLDDQTFMGAIVGRVANRIGGARFSLGNKFYQLERNEGSNHLHGASSGINKKNWILATDSTANAVALKCHSANGESGYPANVDFGVVYTLAGDRLRIEMTARVDQLTPINMVQHNYFNLLGQGNILEHSVQIAAANYTPLTKTMIPTGEIKPVAGTRFDFRSGRILRAADGKPAPYDVNFALLEGERAKTPVTTVLAPDNSLSLKLWSNQPGLQLYTGEYINSASLGWSGERYGAFSGLALEDQGFPDAVNHENFPSTIVSPEAPYQHWCAIEIRTN